MNPPRWLGWLMALVSTRHRDVVTDDLLEEYQRRVRSSADTKRAARWLRREAVRAVFWASCHLVRDSVRGDALALDVRHAFRRLLRDPVFTAVAIASLTLGIGANTAVFSVVHAVLIRPLPYPESERLVRVGHAAVDGSFGITAHTSSNYVVWRASATSFESMAAYGFVSRSLTGHGGDAELLQGVVSIGSIFDVLGVPAFRGRTFHEADDGSGPEGFVVVSHAFWQDAFGDGDAIGHTVVLGGRPYEVMGVMPPGFAFPVPGIHFWITDELENNERATSLNWNYRTVARLAPGRTVEQAAAEMAAIATRLREERPEANRNITAQVVPLREVLVGDVRPLLLVLTGTLAMVLVIACLNLANLLLARGAARQHEIALRTAIGAAPGRLLRLLFTESLVVALLGGMAGLVVGWACVRGIVKWRLWNLPRVDEIGLDATVVGVTLLLAGASALLFGGMPAVTLARASVGSRLGAARRATARRPVLGKLVVAQVALSVVLLVGAGLLTRSFLELTRIDPGFEADSRLVFRLSLPDDYPVGGRVPFFRELEERLGALPGVRSVGITTAVPVFNLGSSTRIRAPDSPVPEDRRPEAVAYRVVSPDYLRAIGTDLKQGRPLSRADGQDGTPALLVSESMARAFWPGESALGRRVRIGLSATPGATGQNWLPEAVVVGVVGDVSLLGLSEPAPPAIYIVHEMVPYRGVFGVVVHTDGSPLALAGSVRAVVRDMDPALPVFGVGALDDVLSASVAPPLASMMLLGILGGVGLLIAMIGVYGVLSLHVSRRQKEIGIRMALGADAADVRRAVMRAGMSELAWGLALGLVGSVCLTRFLRSLLFQVSPTDAVTFLGISLLLAVTAAVATYLPARRATLVDPVVVLGAE